MRLAGRRGSASSKCRSPSVATSRARSAGSWSPTSRLQRTGTSVRRPRPGSSSWGGSGSVSGPWWCSAGSRRWTATGWCGRCARCGVWGTSIVLKSCRTGSTRRDSRKEALRYIDRFVISVYFDEPALSELWRRWLTSVAPHVELQLRVHCGRVGPLDRRRACGRRAGAAALRRVLVPQALRHGRARAAVRVLADSEAGARRGGAALTDDDDAGGR
jgi:hypothetical protein